MNIPEGATHYHIMPTLRIALFYKRTDDGVWYEKMSTNRGWQPLCHAPVAIYKIEDFPNELR